MRDVTEKTLVRAFVFSGRRVKRDPTMFTASESAGFVLLPGKRGEREGWQVFVCLARYSDVLLKKQPETGGLVAMADKRVMRALKAQVKATEKRRRGKAQR